MTLKIKNADGTLSDLTPTQLAQVQTDLGILTQLTWTDLSGNPTDNNGLVSYLASLMLGVNHAPQIQTGAQTTTDAVVSSSLNLLQNATDADGDTVSVSVVSYNNVAYTAGATITTTYGSLVVTSAGVATYTIGNAARALSVGQQITEQFSYTAIDGSGGMSTKPFSFTVVGTNNAPITMPDAGAVPNGKTVTGNILSNDYDPEGAAISVIDFTVNGTVYSAGTQVNVSDTGLLTIGSDGAWSFAQSGSYVGSLVINYSVTDSNSISPGTLTLNIFPPEPTTAEKLAWYQSLSSLTPDSAKIAPNPLTRTTMPDLNTTYNTYSPWDWGIVLPNQTGDISESLHFRVGPGMEYTSLNDVPWNSLIPGDTVFIYYRGTAYAEPIQLQWARGDQNRWIRVIGVPGPNGERPIITGKNAVFPSNFTTQTEYYGGIIGIGPISTAVRGWKPGYIHIHGLEIREVRSWNTRTLRDGTTSNWSGFDAGIYGRGINYLTVSGCKFEDCGQGSFLNSTPFDGVHYRWTSQNIHYLFNYFNICGNPNLNDHEHTIYHEGIAMCYEYNWFDPRYPNSTGLQMKERSAGIIYRYNVMDGGNYSMIAFQDPDSDPAELTGVYDIYGSRMVDNVYMYGNLFLIRDATNNFPSGPVAWGAGIGGTNTRAGNIYFYNNVTLGDFASYTVYAPQPPAGQGSPQETSCAMFNLNNASPTVVHAYNNMAYNYGAGKFGLFALQGWADFKSNVFSPYLLHTFNYIWGTDIAGTPFDGTGLNGLSASTFDPKVRAFSLGDYYLLSDSPYKSLTQDPHADVVLRGLLCTDIYPNAPYGIARKPVEMTAPSISESVGAYLYAGTTANVVAGTYAFGVDTLSYEFKIGGTTVGSSTSYTPQAANVGQSITLTEHATNAAGTTDTTITYTIIAADQPANTVAPTISGLAMENLPIVVDLGIWTNSPASYTIDILLDGVSVGSSYTPVTADIGKSIAADVTATGSAGSYTTVRTASKTIVAEQFAPDAYGVWQFYRLAENTTIYSMPDWSGSTPNYYSTTLGLVGNAQFLTGCWYTGVTSTATQSVGAVFSPMTTTSYPYLYLQATADQNSGYQIQLIGSVPRLDIYLNSTLVQSTATIAELANIATQETKMVCTLTNNGDGTAGLEVFINGTSVYTHTFSGADVISNGYPGFRAPGTGMPMKKWTYNPSASTF
jgi:VCBS repeat-containing protein